MSNLVKVNSWPSGTQCIAWSALCELALACGEYIELLVPRFERLNRSRIGESQWHHVRLQVTKFTEEERPQIEAQDFKDWSIGEEISAHSVQAVSWTPPGVAKHARSALLVLTTSLVLALWECTGRPEHARSWRRRLVVNKALAVYFRGLHEAQPQTIFTRRTRVRAFAWASTAPRKSHKDLSNLLAVANDNNEILILCVRLREAPAAAAEVPDPSVTVVARFEAFGLDSRRVTAPYTFDDYISKGMFARSIAWSPWSIDESGEASAFLAYSSMDEVYICRVEGLGSPAEWLDTVKVSLPVSRSFPLQDGVAFRWFPRQSEDGLYHLVVLCAERRLACISLQANEQASFAHMHETVMDGDHWDACPGIVFLDGKTPEVCISYLFSFDGASQLSYSLPHLQPTPKESTWQAHLLGEHASSNSDQFLTDRLVARVWGVTASPRSDIIAAFFSQHPMYQVEYIVNSEQKGFITLSNCWPNMADDLQVFTRDLTNANESTTEAWLVSLKRWLEKNRHSSDGEALPFQEILDRMTQAQIQANPATEPMDIESVGDNPAQAGFDVFGVIRSRVDSNIDVIRSRCHCVLNTVYASQYSREDATNTLVKIIANELTSLPPTYSSNLSNRRVLQNYALELQLVDSGTRTLSNSDLELENEVCEICTAVIPFDAAQEAKCLNGHQFVRCGLTFLTIQAPGLSKYCGVCGKEALSDESLLALDPIAPHPQTEKSQSHQSIITGLRDAFDSCLYCGGRFVG